MTQVFAVSSKTVNKTMTVGQTIKINPTSDMLSVGWVVGPASSNSWDLTRTDSTETFGPGLNIVVNQYKNTETQRNLYSYSVTALSKGKYIWTLHCLKTDSQWGNVWSNYDVIYNITVVDVESITLPSTLSLQKGQEYTFTPLITHPSAQTTLEWQSLNPSIASIDSKGKVTALSVGTAIISCTAENGVSATCKITVTPVIATDLKLNYDEYELEVGKKILLEAIVLPNSTENKKVTWKSSNENVAIVSSSGYVTALSTGYANITATTKDGSDISANCLIHVFEPMVLANSISLNLNSVNVEKGKTTQLVATLIPSNVSNPRILWTSSVPQCVSVSDNGIVTGLSEGCSTITASTTDGTGLSASCVVTVLKLDEKENDNDIYVEDACGFTGGIVTLPINIRNSNPVTGFQFNVVLPDGFSVEKVERGSRTKTKSNGEYIHNFSSSTQTDGSTTVLCFSVSNVEISGNDGEVALITIRIPEGISQGDYTITLKNIELANEGGSIIIGKTQSKLTVEKNSPGHTEPEAPTADYAMSITPVYSTSGTSVNLSVCMTNKNDINGFQFDLVLPEGITAQKNSRGKYVFNIGERGDDHTFSSILREDGSIRVVCTSLENTVFSGNSGEVCQIPVDLAENLINGVYTVTLKNVSLSDVESTDIQASDVEGEVTILNDYFEVGTASGSIGKVITLPVSMKNKSTDINGFQCDVVMPEGFSIATNDKGKYLLSVTERGDDHSFSALDRGNNTVRIVCTSLTNASFTGTEGDLFEISLATTKGMEAGEYEIMLTNIALSNTASQDIPVADCKGMVTLKSFTPGDVNNDGKISVADVTAGISFVLGNESPSFIREAADMDANDEVKVNDVTAIISLVLNEGVSQAKGRMLAAKTTSVETDAELYIEPFTIAPGEQKYINVMLDNPDLVTIGWQADVTLPEGLSFVTNDKGKYDVKTNEARTDGYSISTIKVDGKSNTVRYVGVSMENYAIEGESGAIMSVLVEAADNMTEGEYTGYVSNVALSDENSADVPLNDSEYIATVAETKIDYATGYSLVIKPFKAAAGTAYTLTMDMNCVDEDITDIEFDIVAPEVLARTKSGRAFKAPAFANDERIYVDDHSIDMTTDGHVTIEAITADEYRMIAGTSGSLVNFFYTANSGIAEGMYQFEIKNIKMTKDDGTVLDVAPYSADVYVGSPKAEIENGCVAFHGDYSTNNTYTLLKEAMPSGGVGAIDLTCVTAVPANTTIGSDGMLVYTSNDLKLKNTKNVVIGNTCDNLSLSDQYDFSAPKTFTAANATYTRPMTNEWGTVCLPYEVQSDDNVAYYNIIDVQNGTLTIQKYETLPANTPALMQKVNGDAAVCEAHDVMVGGAMNNVTGEVTMHGSYANNIMVTDANAYYIKNNKFWLNNQYFYIDAFRAYFTLAPSAAKSGYLTIGDTTTAIDTLINGDKVAGVWSTNGVMRNNVEKGMNIIKMADGKCVKVLVK